jgi:hypothetical protein
MGGRGVGRQDGAGSTVQAAAVRHTSCRRSLTTANSSSGNSHSRDQTGLFARVEDQPWAEVPAVHTDVADRPHHGRPEKRTLKILAAGRAIGFPYARQLIDMTRERVEVSTGKRGVDIVYAICSVAFEQAPPRMPVRYRRVHGTCRAPTPRSAACGSGKLKKR